MISVSSHVTAVVDVVVGLVVVDVLEDVVDTVDVLLLVAVVVVVVVVDVVSWHDFTWVMLGKIFFQLLPGALYCTSSAASPVLWNIATSILCHIDSVSSAVPTLCAVPCTPLLSTTRTPST